MDAGLVTVVSVFMRWVHIFSVVTIVGGFLYARYVLAPALAGVPAVNAAAVSNGSIARFRPILYTALGAVLLSGLYNYLTKPSYPPHYHAVIGVKFLLVLHIFATSILYTIPNANEGNRQRRLTSLVISGVLVIALSAVLRWMTLNAAVLK
jgi:hypothetical protein